MGNICSSETEFITMNVWIEPDDDNLKIDDPVEVQEGDTY